MQAEGSFGRTIQLFLVNGKPNGLRKATIHGWTGLLFVSGNSDFGSLTARKEVDRTGIYILSGPDSEKADATRTYIGSGNSVAKRIKKSAIDRDFWETVITITTSDDDLSRGHAEYLEALLIEKAAQAGRVTLDNGTQPGTSGQNLPEADVANMEQFVSNLRIILPVIGLDMLEPQPCAMTQTEKPVDERIEGEVQFEIHHRNSGVKATAVEEAGEFVVLEGSEACAETGRVYSYSKLRKQLIADDVLVEDTKQKLRFAKPWSFDSPSAAASVVLDRQSNGRTEWKVKGLGQTYHDWQQAEAEQPS